MLDTEPPLTPISDEIKPDEEAVDRHAGRPGNSSAELPAVAAEQQLARR